MSFHNLTGFPVILGTGTYDSALSTKQTIFTVPAGTGICIVVGIVLYAATAVPNQMSWGFDTNASDVSAAANHGSLTSSTIADCFWFSGPPGTGTAAVRGTAGNTFGAKRTATGNTGVCAVHVLGFIL